MAMRVLERSHGQQNDARKKRMQSIITTCEIAESVMNFVITISQNRSKELHENYTAQYDAIVKRLPRALDFIASSAAPISDITNGIKDNLTEN